MRSSFITILTVLASTALAVPQRHPHGPPEFERWHPAPPGLEPSATASVPAGILPSNALGAGSTGTPIKLSGKAKKVSGVAGAGSTGTSNKLSAGGVPGVAGAFSTGSPAVPAATASVSLTPYDKR